MLELTFLPHTIIEGALFLFPASSEIRGTAGRRHGVHRSTGQAQIRCDSCWRAINTCCSSQAGMHLALTLCNEVSFLLQWETEARPATAWQ